MHYVVIYTAVALSCDRSFYNEKLIWSCSPLSPSGLVLLQQTDGDGRTALDLVPTIDQREELLHSAQVGDSTLRKKGTEILNLPLLEAGSFLLAHLISSYQRERGLHGHTEPSNVAHRLDYRLVRALETHSFQRVTLGWTDQRAVRLVEDAETLLELSRGRYLGQIPQAVRECKGENTMFLMEILGNLKSQGETLVTDLWQAQQTYIIIETDWIDNKWASLSVTLIKIWTGWLCSNSQRPLKICTTNKRLPFWKLCEHILLDACLFPQILYSFHYDYIRYL